MIKKYILLFVAFFAASTFYAQNNNRQLNWKAVQSIKISEEAAGKYLYFEGAQHLSSSLALPVYQELVTIHPKASKLNVILENVVFQNMSDSEVVVLKSEVIFPEIKINIDIEDNRPSAFISFVPIRINENTGQYEKLVSFKLNISPIEFLKEETQIVKRTYASVSKLASGDWYRIGVTKDGIYKIDLKFLEKTGIDLKTLDPRNLQLYGNGGGMLPYLISTPNRIDDLAENAIEVVGESDGVFNETDYILFYGESPHRWVYNSTKKNYEHVLHLYTDTTYYFLTIGSGFGKRMSSQSSLNSVPTNIVTSFNDYSFHEVEAVNLIKSGREWYGEHFNNVNNYDFSFDFPNNKDTIKVRSLMCFKDMNNITFTGGAGTRNFIVSGSASGDLYNFCTPNEINYSYVGFSNKQDLTILKSTSGEAWLNYIELNAKRQLIMSGSQMLFRDIKSVGVGKISEFLLSNANLSVKIWEVTDPINVKVQNISFSGSTLNFILPTDSLRELIAFDGQIYLTPVFFNKINNQNLHGFGPANMVIVTHPNFINQAQQIADMHIKKDSLSVIITTPQEIYNEFSSGAQDITAIRDFAKMIYDKSTGIDSLRYLMLLGDGSYNNKDRTLSNTNFIPTFQSQESTNKINSYTSDDYLGFLSDNDGDWALKSITADKIDIGVGRLPVKSISEAQGVTNKILNYVKTDPNSIDNCNAFTSNSVFGDWRNTICFLADDEDQGIHLNQADSLSAIIVKEKDFNIEKIYLDTYQQFSVAGGKRYPDVTEAINSRVGRGALIINYTGHGGELGLTEEEVLGLYNIDSWKNFNKLPLFVTATCEFSRFDDPGRTSAGEQVLLNPEGGGIALLSTLRLVYSSYNYVLNSNFYAFAFKEINGQMPRLGDLYRLTKNISSNHNTNMRNFTLLGDPALRLAYPKESIVTETINSHSAAIKDTLRALGTTTVTGYIKGKNGAKLTDFNGVIYPTVYDKQSEVYTLGNDEGSPKSKFKVQKNVLYKGKASVTNGNFSFSFIVPKDISYQNTANKLGKISYYAHNGITDANGYYDNIEVTGSDPNAPNDVTGPQVEVFMNDSNFVFGGTTNENPAIYAVVRDSNGVNTVGNGIGHDITAILDENTEKSILLNDYYESDLNSYKSGKVKYSLSGLSEGNHSLKIKVWDVYNNSSQAYTEFTVAKSAELALNHVLNYPNPFTTKTKFFFEHNQGCDQLDVQIQVFTISGKLVKTIDTFVHSEGFRSQAIEWDGRDEYGDKIGKGVYVYRLKVRTSQGKIANKFEKLVILN